MLRRFPVHMAVLALATLSLCGCPASRSAGCFEEHVRDAMTLNRARLPAYSDASLGRSEAVSLALIRSERGALLAALFYDGQARKFRERGVPLLCSEFEHMDQTPALQVKAARPRPPGARPDTGQIQVELKAAWDQGGFFSLRSASHRVIKQLEERPAYDCMLRHMLESIRRAAHLAPHHAQAAQDAGLNPKAALRLSRGFIKLHMAYLPAAARLDALALPLQQEGIPIICGDVPPIALEPEPAAH